MTIAPQVICTIPDSSGGMTGDGEPATEDIGLDDLLNQYADELNANTAAIANHEAQLQLVTGLNYAVCDTVGGDPAKVVGITPFVLNIGEEVTVKFTNDNMTSAATLNVSNTGAKPIMYKGQALPGLLLTGVQKFSYDGVNWNVIGDFDTNTDTTYDILSIAEALAGSEITPRTVNANNFNQIVSQISSGIVNDALANGFDISGLQSTLNNLIFQLAAAGVIVI